MTRGLRRDRRRRPSALRAWRSGRVARSGFGLRDGSVDGDLAVGRGVEGLLVAADQRTQAGVGDVAEGHLRVRADNRRRAACGRSRGCSTWARSEVRSKTTSCPLVLAVAVRSPRGLFSTLRPRASMLALRVAKSGAAPLRRVAAPSAASCRTPPRPGLASWTRVDAGELELVALHPEAHLAVFHIVGRMGEDPGGGDVRRTGVEAEAGQLDGGVGVADVGLEAVEGLVVRRAFDDGEVGD